MVDSQLTAFLSTSFSEIGAEERRSIKDALAKVFVRCEDLDDLPKGESIYSAVRRSIEEHQFTVLNATQPKPFTLFEIGLCTGFRKPKPVICIFNNEGKPERFDVVPKFLRKIPVITYNLSTEKLDEMAAKVRREAEYLLTHSTDFEVESISGVKLRLKMRTQKTVYISYPNDPVWSQAISTLAQELGKNGYRVVTESDAAIYHANDLQIAIRCASLATICIVDTSGEKDADLLQSYKLGVCYAAKKQPPLRIERVGKTHESTFDCLPGSYETWRDIPHLVKVICQFIDQRKTKRRTKK